jgi:hypothetical protein
MYLQKDAYYTFLGKMMPTYKVKVFYLAHTTKMPPSATKGPMDEPSGTKVRIG